MAERESNMESLQSKRFWAGYKSDWTDSGPAKPLTDIAHMGSVPAEPKESDYPHGTFSTPAANAVIKSIHEFNLWYANRQSPINKDGEADRRHAMILWLAGARGALFVVTEPLMQVAMVRAFTAAIESFGG